jgi:hypothetical protein
MNKWKEYMSINVPAEEVESKWIPKYYEEDRPAKLINHVSSRKKMVSIPTAFNSPKRMFNYHLA